MIKIILLRCRRGGTKSSRCRLAAAADVCVVQSTPVDPTSVTQKTLLAYIIVVNADETHLLKINKRVQ
jgi:hypothetical protein